MRKGWHKESKRHSLAARGVKTAIVSDLRAKMNSVSRFSDRDFEHVAYLWDRSTIDSPADLNRDEMLEGTVWEGAESILRSEFRDLPVEVQTTLVENFKDVYRKKILTAGSSAKLAGNWVLKHNLAGTGYSDFQIENTKTGAGYSVFRQSDGKLVTDWPERIPKSALKKAEELM